jgi:hypothetical protein
MCYVLICNGYHVSLTLYICCALETKSCTLALPCLSKCNNLRSAELILIKSDTGESTFRRRVNFFDKMLTHVL